MYSQIIRKLEVMYRERTHVVSMARWMRMDCHDTCLRGSYQWPETNQFLLPSPTSHRTFSRGYQPHALSILAVNSLRLRVGQTGIAKGPLALQEIKEVIITLPVRFALAVRIQSWHFVVNPNSRFYGPIVSDFRQWERSETEELRIIKAEKARIEALEALRENN